MSYVFHCQCGNELTFDIAGYDEALKYATSHGWLITLDRCYCKACEHPRTHKVYMDNHAREDLK